MGDDVKNEYYKNIMEQFGHVGQKESDSESGEYNILPNEINIEEYDFAYENNTTAEYEFNKDITVINILTYYYKQINNIKEKITIFDGIDSGGDITTTNKCMEFIYGEIFRYEKSDLDDKDVLYDPDCDIDINKYRELYCLLINNEPVIIAPFTLSIATYLSSLDWLHIDWQINNLI
jgi:hypothetical protein